MDRVWEMDRATRLRTTLNRLDEETPPEWTFDDLIVHLRHYKRMAEGTIRKRILQLQLMERHPHAPVRFNGTRRVVVETFGFYVNYRENVDHCGSGALVNDHKAIRALGDFLGIPPNVWPTQPTQPAHSDMELPSPEQIYELLHTDYLPNHERNYDNALLRYMLAISIALGFRFPSEAWAAKVTDLNLDRHTIVVTEPKKSRKRRLVLIEPEWMCCGRNVMNLQQWLRWRAKVEPRTDALFPRADGTPFPSPDAMRKRLYDVVIPRFPWFNPYMTRHWSVNARLVEWEFDYARVAQFHGHESVNMTKNRYEHSSRVFHRVHGQNWIDRAFRRPPQKRRIDKGPKINLSMHSSRGGESGPEGIRTPGNEIKSLAP